MKPILLIINTPPPYQGSTIMNKLLIDCLAMEKIAFIHRKVESAKELDNLGKLNLEKLKSGLSILGSILRDRKKFDIAYLVMSVEGFAFYRHALFILLLQLLGKKYILHLRSLGFHKKHGLSRIFTQRLFKKAFLIQHSPHNQFDIQGYQSRKLFFVPNGWNDQYECYKDKIDNRLSTIPDTTEIIFLSNLFPDKGLFTVLRSIVILRDQSPERPISMRWNFVGKWDSESTQKEFYKFIEEHKISSYIGHVGPLYNEEKYEFLSKMDILVFPTYYKRETWGNVILEAMMFKIPVVATDYVSIPEMVKHGINGYLVKKEDANALAEYVSELSTNHEKRRKFGENGRELFVCNFTHDKFQKNMISVLKEVSHV